MRFCVVGSTEAAARALWAAATPGCDYEIAAIHPSCASFESYRALLGRRGVDAVYLGLQSAQSFAYAHAALAAGVHVLCDELPTASAREWSDLAGVARSHSARARLATRADHACVHRAAIALTRSERLGSVRAFSAVACTPRDDHEALLLECVNTARRVLGAEPDAVVAVSRTEIPPVLSVALHFPPDCLAFIACGFDRAPCVRYDITASEGDVRVLSGPSASGSDELFATVSGVRLERRFAREGALGAALAHFASELADPSPDTALRAEADACILAAIEYVDFAGCSVRLKPALRDAGPARASRRRRATQAAGPIASL